MQNNKEITYWTNKCKNYNIKKYIAIKRTIKQLTTVKTSQNIKQNRYMLDAKNLQKRPENLKLPFTHKTKHEKLHEVTTTGIKIQT